MKKEEYLSVPKLISRGWTKSIINKLLPTYDIIWRNPFYHSASPMKGYLLSKVEEVESSYEFLTLKEKSAARKIIATKAVSKKRDNNLLLLKQDIKNTKFTKEWPKDYNIVVKESIKSYNDFQERYDNTADNSSSPEFLARNS